MIQKVNQEEWIDETGKKVPVKYISIGTRMKERNASMLLRESKRINSNLKKFKKQMTDLCQAVLKKALEEYKAKTAGKGNFTWFNFDRSIKIEVSISDRIAFDDVAIKVAKDKLDEFLGENLDSKTEFVKDLVMDAFSTSHGKIDADKVMSLTKYRSKIKHKLFQEALEVLEQGIRRPGSRTYFRIWEQDKDGKYKLIDLNFSSI